MLSSLEQQQLQIARDTLKMNSTMVRIMGGMTKDEARAIVRSLTGKEA